MDDEDDFLNFDAGKVEENKQASIEFARNYEIFVNDPRGRAILDHWDKTLLRKRTPVTAPVQQYAADEAVRAFIHGVRDQIELAQTKFK